MSFNHKSSSLLIMEKHKRKLLQTQLTFNATVAVRCYQAFIQFYLLQFQSQRLTIRPSRAASPVVDCSTPIRKKVGDEIGKISTLECESF